MNEKFEIMPREGNVRQRERCSTGGYDRRYLRTTLWGGSLGGMECQNAARRLKHIMRRAERLDVIPQDLARLPGFKKLLAQRSCERSRILQTLLPVICTVVVFLLYCYCSHHENNGSQQSLAGHYDDMVSRNIYIYIYIIIWDWSGELQLPLKSHSIQTTRQVDCRPCQRHCTLSVRFVTMRVLLGTVTRIYHTCLSYRVMFWYLIMQVIWIVTSFLI